MNVNRHVSRSPGLGLELRRIAQVRVLFRGHPDRRHTSTQAIIDREAASPTGDTGFDLLRGEVGAVLCPLSPARLKPDCVSFSLNRLATAPLLSASRRLFI